MLLVGRATKEFEGAELATESVALQAIKDGVARIELTGKEIYDIAKKDIMEARAIFEKLMDEDFVKKPPVELVKDALEKAVKAVS